MAKAKSKTIYDVHPGVEMIQKWVAELKEKTGRTLEEWIALVRAEGPKDEKSRREWLKTRHKFGTNSAWGLRNARTGRAGQRGGHPGGVSEGRCSVCGRAVCRRERKSPADLR